VRNYERGIEGQINPTTCNFLKFAMVFEKKIPKIPPPPFSCMLGILNEGIVYK